MSPHAAAVIDGIDIDFTKFQWPDTNKMLLVETAGGILSPMSSNTTMADFVTYYQLPAILVVQNYLGSINHTLLSIEVLKSRGIKLLGLVVSGTANESAETFIDQYSETQVVARIPHLAPLNNNTVSKCANEIKSAMMKYL
jgi:dethiobiotin synthetase